MRPTVTMVLGLGGLLRRSAKDCVDDRIGVAQELVASFEHLGGDLFACDAELDVGIAGWEGAPRLAGRDRYPADDLTSFVDSPLFVALGQLFGGNHPGSTGLAVGM